MLQTKLNVQLLTHTPNPEKVVATAGKLCYSSSSIDELGDKLTEENIQKFVKALMDIHHESPLEHVTFTFAIEGVSRSLTHQLVRHRLASYSQKSQRYVKEGQFEYVIPKDIENNARAKELFIKAMVKDQEAYDEIVAVLLEQYIDEYCIEHEIHTSENLLPSDYVDGVREFKGLYPKVYSALEKKAIENARAVLPNACETKIIVTMNLRTLINFFKHRCCVRAQDEIRELAIEMLRLCRKVAPLLFNKLGASCVVDGVCPEGAMTCGLFSTKTRVLQHAKEHGFKVNI